MPKRKSSVESASVAKKARNDNTVVKLDNAKLADVDTTAVANNKISTLLADNALSKPVESWLQSCPDPDMLVKMVKDYAWIEAQQPCYSCRKRIQRKNLRRDVVSLDRGGQLICKQCYEAELKMLVINQGKTKQKRLAWKKQMVPSRGLIHSSPKYNGIMVDKVNRKPFGTVKRYDPSTRTAEKVTLYSMPECAEGGTVDPDCDVIQDKEPCPPSDDEFDEDDSVDDSVDDSI